MAPRKSDAAAASAATADETRPATATSQAPSPEDVISSPDSSKQSRAADARPTISEKEKEPSKSRNSDVVTIETKDLNMPRSIITRLAKGVLPPNTQVQGSAITGMSKSATVFISHLANAANNLTTNAGKKTIMPSDVFAALDDIEFGFMREHLEAEFAKFSHIQTSKRSDYRKRVAAAKKVPGGDDADNSAVSADAEAEVAHGLATCPLAGGSAVVDGSKSRDVPPQAKKAKRAHEGSAKGCRADNSGSAPTGKADDDEVDDEDMEIAEEEGEDDEREEEEADGEEEDDGEEEEDDDVGDEEEDEEDDADDMGEREDAPDDDEALDSDGSE
ncbi:hypothetical protein SEPCBS57363_005911 [Sporothrix epigloea]|uniref:DNA polymerase epsilon subunit D n=1 Tax=Sporothrix epigloea TaxID=1892477 RepID=A0ABP0E479_9PEZI